MFSKNDKVDNSSVNANHEKKYLSKCLGQM